MSLAEVENMAALQLFTLGNFGDSKCSEVHSGAF